MCSAAPPPSSPPVADRQTAVPGARSETTHSTAVDRHMTSPAARIAGRRAAGRREPPAHQRRLGILAAMMSSPPSSPPSSPSPTRYPRILIIGGGYVGMYTALRLQCKLRAGCLLYTSDAADEEDSV